MNYYLAIDIGASSGRHIIGYIEDGKLLTDEVFRFSNGPKEENGHLIWDIASLLQNVKKGIEIAKEKYSNILSLSIDTWGVDYVLLNNNKEILPVYAYRDSRTEEIIDEVHNIISFSELYNHTGIQFQPFNTIYQLYADKKAGRLDNATDYLMLPEYLMYKLCGTKAHEYTNASTTGLVNANTTEFDLDIIDKLKLPKKLFYKLSQPGTVIGEYLGIKVILCATHDTGSAVEGIPMEDNSMYLSSGTWSLLGVKSPCAITNETSEKANYSNEGGVGYIRYQKNIMGMWLVNKLREELCPDLDFKTIEKEAASSSFTETIDANDSSLLSPKSMKTAFDNLLKTKPLLPKDYFSCAYRSLAKSYNIAICELEAATSQCYNNLYIVGGGAKNMFLNQLTEKATNKKVIALPIEATALGNLKIQMETIL